MYETLLRNSVRHSGVGREIIERRYLTWARTNSVSIWERFESSRPSDANGSAPEPRAAKPSHYLSHLH